MAEGATSLKGLRAQMAAAAQAQAEERRSLSGNSPGPAANTTTTTAKTQGPRPVIDGAALRIDDRLRVAKERREEADKQQAARESQILERERKAKLQVERQMEERHRKLEEQRRKEEQRRSAVEEKRRHKQEEEKEHYEAVMRRTLERSQRVEQRQKRWSWGGLSTDVDGRPGDSDGGASSPVAIVISQASPEKPPRTRQVDKRSTSTMNLKQSSEAGISKRLSSSSATLINSPDKSVKRRSSSLNRLPNNGNASQPTKEASKKPQVEQTGPSVKKRSSSLTRDGRGKTPPPAKLEKGSSDEQARRPLVSPMDGGVLSRLLTPTQASLARSKSAAALSAEGADAPASASPMHPPPRGPVRSRSIDRQKSGMPTSVSADGPLDPSLKEKRFTSPGGKRPASPASTPGRNRSPSPAPLPAPKRTPSPAAAKHSPRNRPSSPGGLKQRPPSPHTTSAKPPPIQRPALTPTGPPTLRKRDSKSKELGPVLPVPQSSETLQTSTTPSPSPTATSSSKTKEDSKAMAGTNSAAEAAKILAENRRLAREQKEKEELLRVQREEEERLRKEEEQRLAEEARVRRVEEEKRLAEEKKKQEEEEAVRAEEDRERLEAEEVIKQAELQKEREEAEARALVEAERVRVERDRIMQKNQQERMERKKRIEEIMKRTRKGEQNDFKRDGEDDGEDDEEDDGEEDEEDDGGDGEEEEEVDQMNCETTENKMVPSGDVAMETDIADSVGRGLPSDGPMGEREEPVGSVNGKPEVDDKENNNGSTEEPLAVSPVPKGRLVEGSEFLNEDSNKLVPGLNGKPGPWCFEELIDLNVHSKGRPLLQAPEGLGQGLIDCDAGPDAPRVAFEDKGAPVPGLHPSSQPMEALSEM
ncbi:ensconsin isoform X2 [Hypomesus transpacificus]|uniref:ensconsin isoform X2 n=1 Tax=Hypomesus transpacificus TaxID=137520 RepID=UPI001F07E56B|nr:ensconsin isoform X2 [Hypomesus transpacificus]